MEKRKNNSRYSREEYSGAELAEITRARLSGARRKKNKKLLIFLIYLAFVVIMYLLQTQCGENSCGQGLPFVPQYVSGTDMAVHVIDVGQGDCTLVQGGGVNILIDAGENGMGDRVVSYLLARGVYRIELMILTHPHSDHIGGADTVINEPLISVGAVMMPDLPDEYLPATRTYEDVLDAIERRGCELRLVREDTETEYGLMKLYIYTPFSYGGQPVEDMNDMSLCSRFSCGGWSFLSCGDLTENGEKLLLSRHGAESGELRSTLFKASHHGSGHSNSAAFLKAVSPEYVFIPVGRYNDFGHPSGKLLDALEKAGIQYRRTDIQGSFIYRFGKDGVSIENAA